jgi:hypothetical protein
VVWVVSFLTGEIKMSRNGNDELRTGRDGMSYFDAEFDFDDDEFDDDEFYNDDFGLDYDDYEDVDDYDDFDDSAFYDDPEDFML